VTADRTTFMTVEELAAAKQHVNAVLASGILDQHERAHLIEVRNRAEDAVVRKSREEPRPLRGSADVPTA
jgi:hypothetical protein